MTVSAATTAAQPLPESWQPYAKDGRLHFDEKLHAYYLDGQRVPSVTQVLSLAGLVDLRDIPPHILETARLKGEYVHRLCEFLDQGDLDPASVDPALAGYVQAWERCKEERGFEVSAVEERLFYVSERGLPFAGSSDRRVLFIADGDVPGILDLKTGTRLQPTTALQLAAYDLATCYSLKLVVPRGHLRIAVKLCADGTYEWKRYDDDRDHDLFLAALELAHWRLAHGAKIA